MADPVDERCRCGWRLPQMVLDVEHHPAEGMQARHFCVLVCCPRCDVFIKVDVDLLAVPQQPS